MMINHHPFVYTETEEFINAEGNGVIRKFLEYVTPLIGGSLPEYTRLERHFVGKRMAATPDHPYSGQGMNT